MGWRTTMTAVVCGALIFGGCSDGDSDEDAGGEAVEDTTGGGGEGGGADLTLDDRDAFLEAAVAGNGDQILSECLGEQVMAEVEAGGLTPDEVRAWSTGEAPIGPVQDFISEIEVLTECGALGGGTTDE